MVDWVFIQPFNSHFSIPDSRFRIALIMLILADCADSNYFIFQLNLIFGILLKCLTFNVFTEKLNAMAVAAMKMSLNSIILLDFRSLWYISPASFATDSLNDNTGISSVRILISFNFSGLVAPICNSYKVIADIYNWISSEIWYRVVSAFFLLLETQWKQMYLLPLLYFPLIECILIFFYLPTVLIRPSWNRENFFLVISQAFLHLIFLPAKQKVKKIIQLPSSGIIQFIVFDFDFTHCLFFIQIY